MTKTDSDVIAVMDAHCALCARGARWIARNDRQDRFRIVPIQSPLGNRLAQKHGLDPTDPASWLVLDKTGAHSAFDALVVAARHLGGIWHGIAILKILPRPIATRLYRFVARNRYRLFGTADLCALPDPAVQARLIQDDP